MTDRVSATNFLFTSFDLNDVCGSSSQDDGWHSRDCNLSFEEQDEEEDRSDPPGCRHDHVTDTDANNKSKRRAHKTLNIVSRLPWQNHHGILGEYTGQVNGRMQPHGNGALIYKDGSAETSIWQNGIPVQFWTPGQVKEKQPLSSGGENNSVGHHNTYLPHLDLGDTGAAQDMTSLESSESISLDMLKTLRIHDFAFILRSDGRWTYAIIADKQKDTMKFVLNADGCTKILSKKHWLTSIRSVNPDETFCISAHKKQPQ